MRFYRAGRYPPYAWRGITQAVIAAKEAILLAGPTAPSRAVYLDRVFNQLLSARAAWPKDEDDEYAIGRATLGESWRSHGRASRTCSRGSGVMPS